MATDPSKQRAVPATGDPPGVSGKSTGNRANIPDLFEREWQIDYLASLVEAQIWKRLKRNWWAIAIGALMVWKLGDYMIKDKVNAAVDEKLKPLQAQIQKTESNANVNSRWIDQIRMVLGPMAPPEERVHAGQEEGTQGREADGNAKEQSHGNQFTE